MLVMKQGFSLVEMLVAIALMSIMTVAVVPQLKYLLNFQAASDTQNKLGELLSGFTAAYQANMLIVEADTNADVNFGAAGIMQATNVQTGARCNADASHFTPWASYTGHAAPTLAIDGYGAPLCVLINPQTSTQSDGFPLYYHVVAFVSTGPNNVLDNGTMLQPSGQLTLGGDDTGVVFDGRTVALAAYTSTRTKMQTIAQALQAYYQARYQADPTRSSSIDYWSNGVGSPDAATRWDSSNPGNQLPWLSAAGALYSGDNTDIATTLALSRNDVTDAYGSIMQFENAGPNVRSPDNNNVNLAVPPYTGMVSTVLPGNIVLSQAVVGVND